MCGIRGVREDEEGEGAEVGGRCKRSLGWSDSDGASPLPSPGRDECVRLRF